MKYAIIATTLLLVGCNTKTTFLAQTEPFNMCLSSIRLEGGDAWTARQSGGICCAVAENEVDSLFCD